MGKVERFNRFLKQSLGTVVSASMKDWDEVLDNVLFVYRCSYSRVLEDSPFYMLYGRDCVLPQDVAFPRPKENLQGQDRDQYKMERLRLLKIAYDKLKSVREKEQASSKRYYDRTHVNVDFKVGDLIWVHDSTNEVGKTAKLQSRFVGPYEVLHKQTFGGEVTYRVKNDTRIMLVHVNRMLPYYVWEDN